MKGSCHTQEVSELRKRAVETNQHNKVSKRVTLLKTEFSNAAWHNVMLYQVLKYC